MHRKQKQPSSQAASGKRTKHYENKQITLNVSHKMRATYSLFRLGQLSRNIGKINASVNEINLPFWACSRSFLTGTPNHTDTRQPTRTEGARQCNKSIWKISPQIQEKIFAKRPAMQTLEISVLEERANWLKERLSLTDLEIQKMIERWPHVLTYNIEQKLQPTVDFFEKRLAMDNSTLSRTVKRHPALLGLSIEDNLGPKISWLQNRLIMTDVELGKLTAQAPILLGLSIEDNIEPKLNWLQDRLKLNEIQVSKIFRVFPAIFGYAVVSKLEPTLRWLQNSLSMEDADLAKMILAQPSLLGYDVENNLEPTFHFYKRQLGAEETKGLLLRDPRLFGASLERRLRPRLEQAREAMLTIDTGCLQRMAKMPKEQWQTSLAYQKMKILVKKEW